MIEPKEIREQSNRIAEKTNSTALPALWEALNIIFVGIPGLFVKAVDETIKEEKESREQNKR